MNTISDGNMPPRAAILQFPRRRGRPRAQRPMRDSGTPELVMKRLKQETAEALDLCLERNIITPDQHWCGIHLRWLYTLRYGAPGVRAVDPTHFGGRELKLDDPEWRAAREAEYAEAIQLLSPGQHARPLVGLCIYNERPGFLKIRSNTPQKSIDARLREMQKIQEGLTLLSDHWQR